MMSVVVLVLAACPRWELSATEGGKPPYCEHLQGRRKPCVSRHMLLVFLFETVLRMRCNGNERHVNLRCESVGRTLCLSTLRIR